MIGRLAVNRVLRTVLRKDSAKPAGILESDLTPNGKRCRMCARPAPIHHTTRTVAQGRAYESVSLALPTRMHTKRKTAQNAPTESLYAIRTGRVCATKVATKDSTRRPRTANITCSPLNRPILTLKIALAHARAKDE